MSFYNWPDPPQALTLPSNTTTSIPKKDIHLDHSLLSQLRWFESSTPWGKLFDRLINYAFLCLDSSLNIYLTIWWLTIIKSLIDNLWNNTSETVAHVERFSWSFFRIFICHCFWNTGIPRSEGHRPPPTIYHESQSTMELNSVILTIAGSAVFFRLVNNAVGQLPMPESACKNAWRWRNICTSFVHSIITGIWAVLW